MIQSAHDRARSYFSIDATHGCRRLHTCRPAAKQLLQKVVQSEICLVPAEGLGHNQASACHPYSAASQLQPGADVEAAPDPVVQLEVVALGRPTSTCSRAATHQR